MARERAEATSTPQLTSPCKNEAQQHHNVMNEPKRVTERKTDNNAGISSVVSAQEVRFWAYEKQNVL